MTCVDELARTHAALLDAKREAWIEAAAYLEGRADSLERNGNPYGAYEARNCALALRRKVGAA